MSLQVAEFEYAVLSLAMSGDADVICQRLSKNDFGIWANQEIFQAIDTLRKAGAPADQLTVTRWLRDRKKISEELNGEYVAEIAQAFGLRCNIETYIKGLREKRLARVLCEANERLEDGGNPWILADEIRKLTEEPEAQEEKRHKFKKHSVGEVGADLLAEIVEHNSQPNSFKGVPTGINEIDDITLCWQKGQLIIIGARASEGKTTLALNMADNAANHYKLPVMFVCLEMTNKALTARYFAANSGVPTKLMMTGNCGDVSMEQLRSAMDKAKGIPLYWVDQGDGVRTVHDIENYYMFLKSQGIDIAAVYVDHIRLIEPSDPAKKDHYERVSDASKLLQQFAKRQDIPVVALCQVKRPEGQSKSKKTEVKEPTLPDLRNSGNIEEDADIVGFLHRPHYHDSSYDISLAFFSIAKNRQGPLGRVELHYSPVNYRFSGTNGFTKLKLFDPSKIPKPPGQVIDCTPGPQPEPLPEQLETEESKKPMMYKIFKNDEGQTIVQEMVEGGQSLRAWSDAMCVEKASRAIKEGRVEQLFNDANKWVANQSTELHQTWAEVCLEKLEEAYDRLCVAPHAVQDEFDMSAYGF